jgi:hypothetical protein
LFVSAYVADFKFNTSAREVGHNSTARWSTGLGKQDHALRLHTLHSTKDPLRWAQKVSIRYACVSGSPSGNGHGFTPIHADSCLQIRVHPCRSRAVLGNGFLVFSIAPAGRRLRGICGSSRVRPGRDERRPDSGRARSIL